MLSLAIASAPERRDLEQRERLQAQVPCNAVDEEDGRGADHRAGAVQDDQVGKRDQHPGRPRPDLPRKPQNHRDEHHDHGRIVHEGRDHGRRSEEEHDRAPRPLGRDPADAGDQLLQSAGTDERRAHDEHGADRGRGGIGDRGKHIVNCHEAERQSGGRAVEGRHLVRKDPAHEEREHDGEQEGCSQRL
jgi:hypothetical protein